MGEWAGSPGEEVIAMSKKRPNNAAVVGTCTQRLNALKTHLAHATGTIAVNGRQLKPEDVIRAYQACLDTRATLKTQRAEVSATLGAVAAADTERRSIEPALKAWVINQYGVESKEAHDFGFPPPKVPVRTVESKVTALARGEATRKARHTMGKKQKGKVKGTRVVLVEPALGAAVGDVHLDGRAPDRCGSR
jgi:hypothetical protein